MFVYNNYNQEQMVVTYVGAESTSPCAPLEHLADLLRKRVNSQRYPSIYERLEAKTLEDIENSDSKESASGQ